MFKLFTCACLGALTFSVLSLDKRLKKQSKVVGKIKIEDFDEEFWDEL